MRISTIGFLACGLSLSACSLYFEQDPPDGSDDGSGDGPVDVDPCTLAGPADPPGFPFDVAYYQDVIWTLTRGYCGAGGCHVSGRDGLSGFRVWADNGDPCSMVASFNDFYDHSDFMDIPENSRVLRALDGSRPGHPLLRSPGTAEYDVLYGYIADAWARFRFDSPVAFFDAYVFEQEIQPQLDAVGCGATGCHHPNTALAGFVLYDYPVSGSSEMWQNFETVARLVDFQNPAESTLLYQRATDGHGGVVVPDPDSLLAWIQAGFDLVNR
jgi:hypothetical protein